MNRKALQETRRTQLTYSPSIIVLHTREFIDQEGPIAETHFTCAVQHARARLMIGGETTTRVIRHIIYFITLDWSTQVAAMFSRFRRHEDSRRGGFFLFFFSTFKQETHCDPRFKNFHRQYYYRETVCETNGFRFLHVIIFFFYTPRIVQTEYYYRRVVHARIDAGGTEGPKRGFRREREDSFICVPAVRESSAII